MNSVPSKEKKINFKDEKSFFDQSVRAETVLDHVLGEEVKVKDIEERVAVEEALFDRPIIDADTGRTMSRVLFVTSDTSVLEEGSGTHVHYVKLATFFNEVHILVLIPRDGKNTQVRSAHNMWMYTSHAKHWWKEAGAAKKVAKETLTFNDAVRPDVVVGTDPYEAGWSAKAIGEVLDRPVQIHVSEDFYATSFAKAEKHNAWKKRIARYVLRRVESVRVKTTALETLFKRHFKKIKDLEVLPHFYNLEGYKTKEVTFDLHKTYPQYVFIILAFGPYTADSHLHELFKAVRGTLLNPHIGLIVIGEGPAKELFKEKVELLNMTKNVVLLSDIGDVFPYVKTADVLIETSGQEQSEEHVLRAATAGLPIIAKETNVRKDLFKDGESAFLCPEGDTYCLSQKLAKFINSTTVRIKFAKLAASIVEDRFTEDPQTYYRSFRDSIERVLIEKQIHAQTTNTLDTKPASKEKHEKNTGAYSDSR